MGTNLNQLSTRDQKIAYLAAMDHSLKEISEECDVSYTRTRHMLAPNSKQRNQTLIDAVQEIKTDIAIRFKSMPEIMEKRLKSEIENGDSETAHHYLKIAKDMIKDLDKETPASTGSPAIVNLINALGVQSPPQDVVVNITE